MFAQLRLRLHETIPLATLYHASTIEKTGGAYPQGGIDETLFLARPHPKERKPSTDLPDSRIARKCPDLLCAAAFSLEHTIYGLQAQELNADRGTLFSLGEVASHYISLMRTVQPSRPYLIGGFSAGGLIAFEMAQQLHRTGESVALLALFDSSIDVIGGHWMDAFHSLHVLRRTLRIIHHNYTAELQEKGVGALEDPLGVYSRAK